MELTSSGEKKLRIALIALHRLGKYKDEKVGWYWITL
jgi:hypothetical protein